MPILVRPSGRLVSAREAQPSKAPKPMLVRPSGKLVSAREVQPQGRIIYRKFAEYEKGHL